MKNPNILRQYGGVDIKLKNKNPGISTILYICIVGTEVLAGVHFLQDYLFSGPFIEWFEKIILLNRLRLGMEITRPARSCCGQEYKAWQKS